MPQFVARRRDWRGTPSSFWKDGHDHLGPSIRANARTHEPDSDASAAMESFERGLWVTMKSAAGLLAGWSTALTQPCQNRERHPRIVQMVDADGFVRSCVFFNM